MTTDFHLLARATSMLLMLVATSSSSSNASAQLEWDATSITEEQQLEEFGKFTAFNCRNAGDYPIFVRRFSGRSPSTLVWVSGGGNTIHPGESRTFHVDHPAGLLFDERVRLAEVITDERQQSTTKLRSTVLPAGWAQMSESERESLIVSKARIEALPHPASMSRRSLVWGMGQGEAASEKQVVDVQFGEGVFAAVTGLQLVFGLPGQFDAEVVVVEPGRHYQIEVEPSVQADASDSAERARAGAFRLSRWKVETSLDGDLLARLLLDGPLVVSGLVRSSPFDQDNDLLQGEAVPPASR